MCLIKGPEEQPMQGRLPAFIEGGFSPSAVVAYFGPNAGLLSEVTFRVGNL